MDLEVVIEGVTDVQVVKEIKQQVRKVSKNTPRRGEWTLFVAPSETRGEWDLLVEGPFGSHITSFVAPAHQLPMLIAEQLQTGLSGVSLPELSPAKKR